MAATTPAKKAAGRRPVIPAHEPRAQSNAAVVMERDVKKQQAKSTPAGHVVTMGGVPFKVVQLLLLVEGHGGAAVVTEQKLWKSIARDLGVNTKVVHNASTRLRVLHEATVNRLRSAAVADEHTDPSPSSREGGRGRNARSPRRARTLEERSEQGVGREVGKVRAHTSSARRVTKRATTRAPSKAKRQPKVSKAPDEQEAAAVTVKAGTPGAPTAAATSPADASSHPFFSSALTTEVTATIQGRSKTTKGGTRRGLQKGLQSVSCAVALPDEVQDDVNELTRKETLAEYLAEVGVEKKNLDKVLEAYPQLQHLSVIQNLRPTVRFLTKEIGVAPDMVRKVIVSFPQILGLSIDDNLRPTAQYLLHDVGVPVDRLNKTIVTRPQILGCSVEKNLRPKLELLVEMAGIEREQLPLVISRAPHVLGYSPSNIAHFLIFLLHELKVEQKKVARLLTTSPQLLGLSVEKNIRPKIKFLREEVGITNVGQVIGSFPNILGYSVENNMRPKLEYLAQHILKVPMSKLGRPLEKCPQLLGYSLEKRIKPRYLLLANRGLKLGLSRMLAPTDLEFRRILRIHDAQLAEERRAQQHLAAAAVRAYSWAAEEAADAAAEDDDEGLAIAAVEASRARSGAQKLRKAAEGAPRRAEAAEGAPRRAEAAEGAPRRAEAAGGAPRRAEAYGKALKRLEAYQRRREQLKLVAGPKISHEEVRLSELGGETPTTSSTAELVTSRYNGADSSSAREQQAPTYYWH